MSITDLWLKSVHKKEHDERFEKSDRDGLSVRVSTKGKVVFQFRYRYQGKFARCDLGSYPALSLKDAREEVLVRRAQLEQGFDPRVKKRIERVQISTALTNQQLITRWHEDYSVERKVGANEIYRSFEIHVFPKLGQLPADATGLAEWMDLLEPLAKVKPRMAERLLGNLKQVHKWAFRRGLVKEQPVSIISAKDDLHVNRKKVAGRALSDEEINLVWHANQSSRMALRSKIFVQLVLFFGCRPGELIHARRNEFDFDQGVWEIPPERHKTGKVTDKPLRRPIIPEFVPYLTQAMSLSHHPDMLFSGESRAVKLNDRSVLSFPYNIMNVAEKQFGTVMKHWSMYDLRKTARTNWSTLSEPHICELMLGHVLPGVWQVYDRHDYLEEQAVTYKAWFDRLMMIVGDFPPKR